MSIGQSQHFDARCKCGIGKNPYFTVGNGLTPWGFVELLYDDELGVRPVTTSAQPSVSDVEIQGYEEISRNQILVGPPGTGKTYLTVNKAVEIIDPRYYRDNRQTRSRLTDVDIERLASRGTDRDLAGHEVTANRVQLVEVAVGHFCHVRPTRITLLHTGTARVFQGDIIRRIQNQTRTRTLFWPLQRNKDLAVSR